MWNIIKGFFRNIYRLAYYRLIIPILREKKDPNFIAFGVAVGLFCAFTPIIMQMYLVTAIWIVGRLLRFRFSLPIALALTWVSNGVTNLPLFFSYYTIGNLILGKKSHISYHDFIATFHDGIINGIKTLATEMGLAILIGSGVVMIVTAVAGYIITYRFIVKRRERLLMKNSNNITVTDEFKRD